MRLGCHAHASQGFGTAFVSAEFIDMLEAGILNNCMELLPLMTVFLCISLSPEVLTDGA